MMKVTFYENKDSKSIREYLIRANYSSLYHDVKWGKVIEKSFGHKTFYLTSKDDRDNINGVLPLVHIKSVLFGSNLISLPYFNYGGICADFEGARDMLIRRAVDISKEVNAEYIEFRQEAPFNNELPVKTTKVSMRLKLPSSPDELFKSFTSKLRSQIRRPQKEGMVVKIARGEELDSFYRVFSINMRDLGTPVYPKVFFKNILKYFPEHTWICTIYRKKEAVASGFLAGHKDRLEIPWASSLRKYNRFSPNMLLYWSCLQFACEKGFDVFDFGRSTPGEGTYKFKEQWGANPTQLYWYYWLRDDASLPDLTTKNPKYQIAIKTWKMLPVPVTKIIGPRIVKYIP